MTPAEFIAKWRESTLKESAASQQHFLDLCALVGHPPPAEYDPVGERFCFERGARKRGGSNGWADVWKKGHFGWEYKGKHADLERAYEQLQLYREDLENPPLLVISDMERIVIRTNFTATPRHEYTIHLGEIGKPENLAILRHLFFAPIRLKPGLDCVRITEDAAARFGELADALRARGLDPRAVAHFLDRLVFCLFAEDVDLLPEGLFTNLLSKCRQDPERFARLCAQLFAAMATGGDFGLETIRHFNGSLFDDDAIIALTRAELAIVHAAAKLDWSAVDPSIFGTLFERGLDPAKRSQLGAHYTSREDIETLVEPVVMAPLRREWAAVRATVENLLSTGRKQGGKPKKLGPRQRQKALAEAHVLLHGFQQRLATVKVLDPACGSGNFLYVTLQKLKDLEKEVYACAIDSGTGALLPSVGPWQLHGIELNPYAFDLAQMTVWIGYLQWTKHNGFGIDRDPVLQTLAQNFQNKDAILDLSDPENPREPTWPRVDFIVGNPPFLGGKLLRRELGDEYVDRLFQLWDGDVPREADLCCYWFAKGRRHLESGLGKRVGLLATQGIRGGANREVLKRIKDSGDIFFAESDRPWILDGAHVHVSMVGYDDGGETAKVLDAQPVTAISANLGGSVDLTGARRIGDNRSLAFMGTTKQGAFDITEEQARAWLDLPNVHGRPNSDVLCPWRNGRDVTGRSRDMWIIDTDRLPFERVVLYEAPFGYLDVHVRQFREANPRKWYRPEWWQLYAGRPQMREAMQPLKRYLATPTVAKHRLFLWLDFALLPDHQLIAFARDDDYFFGVLHSRFHELWARALGTQLRERESGFRYTPTTCFETFPLPWAPGAEPWDDARVTAIGEAAAELNRLREAWLNPPDWVREEVLEFPGTVDGPWARFVHEPDERGLGTVRYPRLVPRDERCARELKRRTLTNLYNQRPTWLDLAHRRLDEAVAAAYGLAPDLADDALLAALLERNLAGQPAG